MKQPAADSQTATRCPYQETHPRSVENVISLSLGSAASIVQPQRDTVEPDEYVCKVRPGVGLCSEQIRRVDRFRVTRIMKLMAFDPVLPDVLSS